MADCRDCIKLDQCGASLTTSLAGWKVCTCSANMLRVAQLRKDAVKAAEFREQTNVNVQGGLPLNSAPARTLVELDQHAATQTDNEVDMEIGKGFALEWQLSGGDGFSPFPK